MDLRQGLHAAQRPGSISGSSVRKQDKGSKGHTITHTYQKPLLAPPEGNAGTVWKPSFHECLNLGSFIGRVKEKTMTISAYEMLYIAVSSFWQTSTTQVQCSSARAGFQSWTSLLHSAACCLHTRGIVSSLLDTIPYSIFDNPEPAGEHFHFAGTIGCLA